MLWAVLELMVFVGAVRSGGPGRCGASTLALSQLIDLNILEFQLVKRLVGKLYILIEDRVALARSSLARVG